MITNQISLIRTVPRIFVFGNKLRLPLLGFCLEMLQLIKDLMKRTETKHTSAKVKTRQYSFIQGMSVYVSHRHG